MKGLRIDRSSIIKLSLSLSLLAYSVYVTFASSMPYVLFGMFFSTVGDCLIMKSRGAFTGKEEKGAFTCGVVAFAGAHVQYALGMSIMGNKNFLIRIIIISCFTVAIVSLLWQERKWNCIPYAICLLASTINAWTFSVLAGIGMTLFLISDATICICREKESKWRHIAVWATYVPAQACILTAFLIK